MNRRGRLPGKIPQTFGFRLGRETNTAMLRHADPDEAILIKFWLVSGFRNREIRFVIWRDVDFRNFVVRVPGR